MSGTSLRLIPGIVTILAGTLLAITQTGAAITTDLSAHADSVLDPSAKSWAKIAVDGRTIVLGGVATEQAAIDRAAEALATIPGAAGVEREVALAEPISPYPFIAAVDGGVLSLSGAFPADDLKANWLQLAPGAKDTTTLHSGAPQGFAATSQFAVATAKLFDQGNVTLSDSVLTVSGRARDAAALAALKQLSATVPATLTLAALDVTPPLASPYVWTAKFDGRTVTITGDAPDSTLADRLRAFVPAGIVAAIDLTPASGEPKAFADNTLALLKTLLTLESGEAGVSDATVTLSGAPGTATVADAAKSVVAALGGTATLDPPRVASYSFSIDKTDSALTFAGFAPSAEMRQTFTSLAGSDTSKLQLGRGAPEGFDAVAKLGVDALSHLKTGSFTLDGSKISLRGQAGSPDDFRAVTSLTKNLLPAGLSFAQTDLHPPIASPFTFAASKSTDGTIALKGYVPDEATRAALLAMLAKPGTDQLQPADGAPEKFEPAAQKGLEILALLDTGTLSFDGKSWSLDGSVDSAKKGMAADAAYSIAGLRTAGWTYTVRLPALPTIAPYVFRAQKSASGDMAFSGYVPGDLIKDSLAAQAPGAADSTGLAAGAPADFADALAAGLAALSNLEQGALSLNGETWTLSGEVADAAQRESIQATLTAHVNTANWQLAIQARDSAPVVTPYLWSARKGTDGAVTVSGYVPSEALKTQLAAGNVATGALTIASGEPPGFAENAMAGLAALTHLSRGEASFDGRSWSLSGSAESQADGAAAVAALGETGGKVWTLYLTGYDPAIASVASSEQSVIASASSSAPPAASSAEASSSAASEPPASSASEAASSSESPSSSEASASATSAESSSSAAPLPSSSAESSASSASAEPSSASSAPASDASASAPVEATAPGAIEEAAPLPETLVFSARNPLSGPITLAGSVPSKDVAAALTAAAGAPAAKLSVSDTLPADFDDSATAGLAALALIEDGQLGFDGTRWWLHGRVGDAAGRDAAIARIAALPQGGTWSVDIRVLPAFDICRLRASAVSARNAIAFEPGKRDLAPDSLAVLNELAKDLAVCPSGVVHVQAHTDSDGDASANLTLSVARAETVVAELVKRGIAEDRLYAEGYGETDPVVANDSKANKAKNRRVVIVVSKD